MLRFIEEYYIVYNWIFASFAFLIIPIIVWSIKKSVNTLWKKSNTNKNTVGTLFIFSAFMIVSIFCMRYAFTYFNALDNIDVPGKDNIPLNRFEEFFNCIMKSLLSFGVDENHQEFVYETRQMFVSIFKNMNVVYASNLASIYVSVCNTVAPFLGGAVVFEILASVFPKFRLFINNFSFFRPKYYFSKLNEGSVSMMKNVLKKECSFFCRPIFIFADAYIDDKSENSTELLNSAIALGAICVRDDITNVTKCKFGKKIFILIDENEMSNLRSLSNFAADKKCSYLKDSEIYLFVKTEAYVNIVQQVKNSLQEKSGFKLDELPQINPIQIDKHLIIKMLNELPLYEPLIESRKGMSIHQEYELNVTIVGAGSFGVEMFLATYWYGQMLNCNTTINIVSKEKEENFWDKIDSVNPEIRQTTKSDNDILIYNENGDKNPIYCKTNYIELDVNSSAFSDYLKKDDVITNSDYIFVSLGADETNMATANSICRHIGYKRIEGNYASLKRTVITYVVYDSDLADTLNIKPYHYFTGEKADVYMKAVGSLDELYSVDSAFFESYAKDAKSIDEKYQKIKFGHTNLQTHLDNNEIIQNEIECVKNGNFYKALTTAPQRIMEPITDKKTKSKNKDVTVNYREENNAKLEGDYKTWTNRARAMHKKYKAFSLGFATTSIFDVTDDKFDFYKEAEKQMLLKYDDFARCKSEVFLNEEDKILMHQISWVEHRRWNAFLRSKGFRAVRKYQTYADSLNSYKNFELKLHPCLVECNKFGIHTGISVDETYEGDIIKDNYIYWSNSQEYDNLDILSLHMYETGKNGYDFKLYDYPFSDI